MRVLHINKYLYRRGGAEAYMLDVADLQRRHGHEVALFGMQHPENPDDLPLAEHFPARVELDPPPGGLQGLRAGARMMWSSAAERGVRRALEAFRPDAVHVHNVYHQLSPSVLRPVRRAGVRCVMTLHDYKLACPSYQMLDRDGLCDACVRKGPAQAVLRRCKSGSLPASALLSAESSLHRLLGAYDSVDVLISPSRFLADVMTRAGVGRGRLHVVSNPARATAGPVVPADRRRDLVVAGRLSREKGVDVLVRAMGLLPGGHRLHVAGEGARRQELERLAEEVAPGRVVFHGRLGAGALERLVASSVASVVPSRWYENQPMAVLESAALEVPAVVSALGGLPEMVRDGVDGLVVPPDDPPALASALGGLLARPGRAGRMGRAARERLVVEHDPDEHVRRLDDIYRGHVSPPPAAAALPGGRHG